MPQANITYENPYNKNLVHILHEMDEKHWRKAGTAYSPTMFPDKTGNYFGEKVGGGSPAGQKYILSGNSPAYPPINMNSGMEISSGGSHYAGIDGAVGGKYSVHQFSKDFKQLGKLIKPVAKPILRAATDKAVGMISAAGRGEKANLQRFHPVLQAMGRPAPKSKADVVEALKHLGAKKSHSLKKLHEMMEPYEMEGGKYSVAKFARDFKQLGNLIKPVAKPILKAATDKAVGIISAAGRAKKTNKRAEIVKKVMKDKGMSMIEASSYVKTHGLYKP